MAAISPAASRSASSASTGFAEHLSEKEALMPGRIVLERREQHIAMALVERPGLIAEGLEVSLRAAAVDRRRLDRPEERRAESPPPLRFCDPEERDVQPGPIHLAVHPADQHPVPVAREDGQR